jgi:hypothetical protein
MVFEKPSVPRMTVQGFRYGAGTKTIGSRFNVESSPKNDKMKNATKTPNL